MLESIEFRNGHRFVDNGVGDGAIVCPTSGAAPLFIPFMLARIASGDCRCPLCHEPLGARVQSVTVTDGATVTDDAAGKRRVSLSVTDSAGTKDTP